MVRVGERRREYSQLRAYTNIKREQTTLPLVVTMCVNSANIEWNERFSNYSGTIMRQAFTFERAAVMQSLLCVVPSFLHGLTPGRQLYLSAWG